jgi:hypothetical protein
MALRPRRGRSPRRRFPLGAAVPLAAVGLTAALGGGQASAGTSTAATPSYAALASTAPSGLPLVTSHRPGSASDPSGPTFPVEPPEGATDWPVAETIRSLSLSTPGLSAWIARSSEGGICVLFYDGAPVEGVSALDVGCSAPASGARGASVEVSEIPGMDGKVIAAGVVPDGASAVSERMADGTTVTSQVSGNAWSRIADQAAAAGEQPNEITGG